MAGFACPHCKFPYYNTRVTRHGLVRCGNCGRPFRI